MDRVRKQTSKKSYFCSHFRTQAAPQLCFQLAPSLYAGYFPSPKITYSVPTTFSFTPFSKPMVRSWHFHYWEQPHHWNTSFPSSNIRACPPVLPTLSLAYSPTLTTSKLQSLDFSIIFNASAPSGSRAEVPVGGWFCPSEDIWQRWTFLIVATAAVGYWHLVGRSQGR